MSFQDFSLGDVVRNLNVSLAERSLFADVPELAPGSWLVETLKETVPLALSLGNEKARSEMIIAPVLIEVRRALAHRVSLYSGVELIGDASRGLTGVCDFLFSRSPEQVLLRAPVIRDPVVRAGPKGGGRGRRGRRDGRRARPSLG